jgi:hypothetical protein
MPWKSQLEKDGFEAQRQVPPEISKKQIEEEIPLSWKADNMLWGYVQARAARIWVWDKTYLNYKHQTYNKESASAWPRVQTQNAKQTQCRAVSR